MTLHREGTRYIIIATIVWASVFYFTYRYLAPDPVLFWVFLGVNIIMFLLWFWIIWFFRMPKRTFSAGEQLVVAPCDGKVVVIEEVHEGEYFNDKRLQLSIFMSPLNVHVNRSPIDGIIKYVKYHPGKYLVAWHPKSSTDNERTTVVFENSRGALLLRQIAGALARRIKYYVKEGQEVKQNDEFGFIRFGSRVDVFLPLGTAVDVKLGQPVKGGVTVLAKMP